MMIFRPPGVGGNVTPEGTHFFEGNPSGTNTTKHQVTLDNPAGRVGQIAVIAFIGNISTQTITTPAGWESLGNSRTIGSATAVVMYRRLLGNEVSAEFSGVVGAPLARVDYYSNAGTVAAWQAPTAPSSNVTTTKALPRSVSTMAGSISVHQMLTRASTDVAWTNVTELNTGMILEETRTLKQSPSVTAWFGSTTWRKVATEAVEESSGTVTGPNAVPHAFSYSIAPLVASNPYTGIYGASNAVAPVTPTLGVWVPVTGFSQSMGPGGGNSQGFQLPEAYRCSLAATAPTAGGFGSRSMRITANGVELTSASLNAGFNVVVTFNMSEFTVGPNVQIGMDVLTSTNGYNPPHWSGNQEILIQMS